MSFEDEFDSWLESAEAKEMAHHVKTVLAPKVNAAAFCMSINADKPDLKLIIETGIMVLMDKPILLIVPKGTKLPPHLVKIAKMVVEIDFSDEQSKQLAAEAVRRMAETLA